MANKQSREDFNKELIETLQKIVNPAKLNRIYDHVINYQNSQQNLEKQQFILGIIQDYLKELDHHFKE